MGACHFTLKVVGKNAQIPTEPLKSLGKKGKTKRSKKKEFLAGEKPRNSPKEQGKKDRDFTKNSTARFKKLSRDEHRNLHLAHYPLPEVLLAHKK